MCVCVSFQVPPLSPLGICRVLEGGNQGWQAQPPVGTSPPHLDHPTSGCQRMQRISGAKAAHFLWPGDRPSHTEPLLAALILGSSACPSWKRLPHNLGLTFLCLLEAEEIDRVQVTQVPLLWKSGFNLKTVGDIKVGLDRTGPGARGGFRRATLRRNQGRTGQGDTRGRVAGGRG